MLRIDNAGHSRLLAVASADGPPAVGLGSVWTVGRSTLTRLDARTGRIQGRLDVARASNLAVTIGGGSVWLLADTYPPQGRRALRLLKINPTRMRIAAQTTLTPAASWLAYGDGELWLGTVSPGVRVVEINPRTLARKLFANLG